MKISLLNKILITIKTSVWSSYLLMMFGVDKTIEILNDRIAELKRQIEELDRKEEKLCQ